MLLIIAVCAGHWSNFRESLQDRRIRRIYSLAAILIGLNWLTYVWSVNSGFIVQVSLGYYINPLINVLFGVVILRERLRTFQWVSIALAAMGVIYLAVIYGSLPWISLVLACSFACYAFIKKQAPLGSLQGLLLETLVLLPPAIGYLLYLEYSGSGQFVHNGLFIDLMLFGTGTVTIVPLLFYASAAKRIPLSTLGVLQYVSPTLQLALGVFVYGEAFNHQQFLGFAAVWIALVVFGVEGVWASRK